MLRDEIAADQTLGDDHPQNVGGDVSEVGRTCGENLRAPADLAHLIDPIIMQWRARRAWHREEKALTLRAKGLCRALVGGDKGAADKLFADAAGEKATALGQVAFAAIAPLLKARASIEADRKAVEKRLIALAKQLPVASFVEETRGVGLLSLAAIVGEAGDLSNYANPAKLWKRMGLAVMPDGRQRRVSGDAAILHGYCPERRSVMWNIGECIVKQGRELRQLYLDRKVYELTKTDRPCIAHARAKRYVEKRFLLLLWRAWKREGGDLGKYAAHGDAVAPSNLSA